MMTGRVPSAGGWQHRVAAAALSSLLLAPASVLAQNSLPSSGNVGIGTMTPAAPLQVQGIGNSLLMNGNGPTIVFQRINNAGGDLGLGVESPMGNGMFYKSLPYSASIGTFNLTGLNFATNNTVRMTVDGTGKVGIGTNTPTVTLDVRGDGNIFRVSSVTNSISYGQISNAGGAMAYGLDNASGNGLFTGDLPYSGSMGTFGARPFHLATNNNVRLTVDSSGNVGIGTTVPTSKLHVNGDVRVDGNIAAKYQDVAEWVRSSGDLRSATVVIIDPREANRVVMSDKAYDSRVAGIVSPQPGLLLGEGGEDKAKVAHSGRVNVKVDATYGAIAVGDLLVTSATPGHAMRSQPIDINGVAIHRPGTLIGKALESLDEGQGEILVLLTLQ